MPNEMIFAIWNVLLLLYNISEILIQALISARKDSPQAIISWLIFALRAGQKKHGLVKKTRPRFF